MSTCLTPSRYIPLHQSQGSAPFTTLDSSLGLRLQQRLRLDEGPRRSSTPQWISYSRPSVPPPINDVHSHHPQPPRGPLNIDQVDRHYFRDADRTRETQRCESLERRHTSRHSVILPRLRTVRTKRGPQQAGRCDYGIDKPPSGRPPLSDGVPTCPLGRPIGSPLPWST